MARSIPKLGEAVVAEIEVAWAKPQEEWARRRLLVVRLIAQHGQTVAEIMRTADVCRQTVFVYRDKVIAAGVAGLLKRGKEPGNRPAVRGAVKTEFIRRLEAGQFRQARDAQAWIEQRTRRKLSESGVHKVLRRLGGKLKVPARAMRKRTRPRRRSSKPSYLSSSPPWSAPRRPNRCACGCSPNTATTCCR